MGVDNLTGWTSRTTLNRDQDRCDPISRILQPPITQSFMSILGGPESTTAWPDLQKILISTTNIFLDHCLRVLKRFMYQYLGSIPNGADKVFLFLSVPQPYYDHAETKLSSFGLATLLTTQARINRKWEISNSKNKQADSPKTCGRLYHHPPSPDAKTIMNTSQLYKEE